LVYDPEYLGVRRGDGVIFIQITLNEGRTLEMKKAFYKALAERLHRELDVRMEDVLINLVEVKKEDWSFGNGIAQYV
ncbi:MAG TPA: tautomerase family protein, partial [Candidatus Binatia bacterium]|nr:tautomerase family protein [Candidatus Binatia bacterium]